MSIRVMSLVWERFPSGGPELLAMLALSDWADDTGGNCHPSIATIARKLRVSRSQTQRIIHRLIEDDWLHVTSGHTGGAPGTTRHYQIDLGKLEETGRIGATPTGRRYATGSTNATGRIHAREGSHLCAETGRMDATQSVIEPSRTVREDVTRPERPRATKGTRLHHDTLPDEGTRLCHDTLPDDWRAFCRQIRPDLNPDSVFDIFRDHWAAQPGQKGVKANWEATWRNWVRREDDRGHRAMPSNDYRPNTAPTLGKEDFA